METLTDFNLLLGIDRHDQAAQREGAAVDRLRSIRPSRRPSLPWAPAPVQLRPAITIGINLKGIKYANR